MSNILNKIEENKTNFDSQKEQFRLKEQEKFDKKCVELEPILKLFEPLEKYGLKAVLHTNEKHFPCPAVHLKRESSTRNLAYYNSFSEIFIYEGQIRSGSCNNHAHKFNTLEDFENFVAREIAKKN